MRHVRNHDARVRAIIAALERRKRKRKLMDMNSAIPNKYKPAIGLIVSIAVAILAVMVEWQDMGAGFTRWTGRIFAILVVLSNLFGLKVNNPKQENPNAR